MFIMGQHGDAVHCGHKGTQDKAAVAIFVYDYCVQVEKGIWGVS